MNLPRSESVFRVAVPVPLPGLFDYLPPAENAAIPPGTRVLVPFGRRRLVGVVMEISGSSTLPRQRLARISRVLDECEPLLNNEICSLLAWSWRYYKHAPGEVVAHALAPALRLAGGVLPEPPVVYRLTDAGSERLAAGPGRAPAQWRLLDAMRDDGANAAALREVNAAWRKLLSRLADEGWVEEMLQPRALPSPRKGPQLRSEQAAAFDAIRAGFGAFRCHLLDGVTGSGKTEVYLRLIEEIIGAGRQALVLVPEIGLTPQLVARFRDRLGIEPAVYHSGQAEGERLRVWADAFRGDARLVLGTRSALFLPLPEAGLIIMDESHDASFKQQEGFRFSARDVAVKRASGLGVPIVLGTATPSLETLHNAVSGRYQWHRLRERATGAPQPVWRLMDLRQQETQAGLTGAVLKSMHEALQRDEQVLVFLNRRGYAPVLLCHECGWHANCHRCDANLTWHKSGNILVCHHCGYSQSAPALCPECAADAVHSAGEGTEQLENFLARRFPEHPLYRFDRDVTRQKGAFERMYGEVREGRAAILVGTQMLAKGHHFPRVTLVVIVNLDQALYSGDFRALERMGQLMTQVAGRAGRAERPGEVVLQTHHPDHPLVESLLRNGYEHFALELLEERRMAALPPVTYQATLRAEEVSKDQVLAFLQAARAGFRASTCSIHGPFPAQMERRSGRWRWYVLVQCPRRSELQAALEIWLEGIRALPTAKRVRWALDVDPQEF